jgi:methyl-accepting chemotaxis protein WspA
MAREAGKTTMKYWTIRWRIVTSFAVILVLMMVMATVAYVLLSRIDRLTKEIEEDVVAGLSYSQQILVERYANYSLTRDYVFRTDAAAKQKARSGILESRAYTETIITQYTATITSPDEQALFESFKAARDQYLLAQDSILVIGLDPKRREEAIKAIDTSLLPAFDKAQTLVEAIVDQNRTEVTVSTRLIDAAVKRAIAGVLATVGVGLVVALISGYLLLGAVTRPLARLVSILDVMRTGDLSGRLTVDDEFGTLARGFNRMTDDLVRLVEQVQQSGVQVNTSVTEIAVTAKEQQATASEIAATTTEIGATSREISSRSKHLVGTMNEVATMAEQSAFVASQGQSGLTHMEETMRRVMDAAAAINAKLAVLNEKAGSISQVVTTITKVADQTNLLSLNAAIEAEKAGEYGRGFAVVATEIRRLADQTAVATYDIEQMVREIQSAVSAGVMGMDKFSEEVRRGMQDVQHVSGQLSQVILQVQAFAPRVESVNDGMQAQASGAEQITQALSQLTEAAQQTVDSLRQSSAAIDELNRVAIGLRSGVARFRLQVA